MGGKSTYMRQVALIALMAHVGAFVPAKAARIGPIDQIFTRIGAADDLAGGRSTFMVEMTESANILHNATESSLVLMDEVGRGTSTFDGLALAWAIARHLVEKSRALTLFATHYFELTRLALDYREVANVHLDAVEHKDTIVFLHAVEEGPASQSYGLQVAALAGVPKAVIQRARRILQSLEEQSLARDNQGDLFVNKQAEPAEAEPAADPLRDALGQVNPDELSPREALGAPLPPEAPVTPLVDIGANLTHASFRDDLDAVLARARAAGVGTIVVTGTSVAESLAAAHLADAHGLYATAGVHPHHARDCDDATIPALREIAAHPRVVAIGECGLDYHRNFSTHSDQERWFVAQLELGIELGKPLFLHSRDAHPRFAEILRSLKVDKGGRPLLHRRARRAARLPQARPVHRHHRLDLRRAARAAPAFAGARDSRRPAADRDRLALPHPARHAPAAQGAPQRARVPAARAARGRARARPPRRRARRRRPRAMRARCSACRSPHEHRPPAPAQRPLAARAARARSGKHGGSLYAEHGRARSRLAHSLRRKFNLAAGDRVALAMKNCPEYYELLFACWHAGLVAVPMNAKLHPREFAYILENSGAKLCFVTPDLERAVPHGISIASADFRRCSLKKRAAPRKYRPTLPPWLFYTSGTTGVPKGAVLTHRNLLFATQAYFADIDKLAPGDSILHAAPLSHGSGLYGLPHFAAGALNVIPESGHFEPEEIYALLDHWRNVSFFAAPTMIVRLLASPAARAPANLKTITYGGAPMYVADSLRAIELFGPRLYQLYGQGESPMTISGLTQAMHAERRALSPAASPAPGSRWRCSTPTTRRCRRAKRARSSPAATA